MLLSAAGIAGSRCTDDAVTDCRSRGMDPVNIIRTFSREFRSNLRDIIHGENQNITLRCKLEGIFQCKAVIPKLSNNQIFIDIRSVIWKIVPRNKIIVNYDQAAAVLSQRLSDAADKNFPLGIGKSRIYIVIQGTHIHDIHT